jgi:ribosomal protein S19E (S16A)
MAIPNSYKPKSVKDVAADEFIKAYAAHLESNDKVCRNHKKFTDF